jgi:hypothetical protein
MIEFGGPILKWPCILGAIIAVCIAATEIVKSIVEGGCL